MRALTSAVRLMHRRVAPVFAVAVVLAGCGPTHFKAFCEQSAGAICPAVFRCTPEDARKVWLNFQDCTAMSKRTEDDLDNMVGGQNFRLDS